MMEYLVLLFQDDVIDSASRACNRLLADEHRLRNLSQEGVERGPDLR